MVASSDTKEKTKHENEFRRRIKEYTSGNKPHHCLVESIEIETPSDILSEGVMLVDTPGLDDTERFRVQLTERAVQNVDAILFLTKSGAAYGQSEKDFLLSLLRKTSVKQLIFVVTQVDHTYEQHVRQARDQDEDPESIRERIEAERRRIKTEIEGTFDELDADGSSISVERYREQLAAIEIAFTSATNHRDWKSEAHCRFPLSPDDPGGMKAAKGTLFKILSTESRLADARLKIQTGTDIILQRLISVLDNRRSAMRRLKDREVAERKLATFRSEFQQNCEEFEDLIQKHCADLNAAMKNRAPYERLAAQLIAALAGSVLDAYQSIDSSKHWRTRRGRNWGHMHGFQSLVANKVFPKVAEQLNAQAEQFGLFVDNFSVHLDALSNKAEAITQQLDIGGEFHLDIAGSLEKFLKDSRGSLQELVAGEEGRIIAMLENFVTEEVEEKILEAREKVADIWGKGTNASQTSEVREFYSDVRSILLAALSSHVLDCFSEFRDHLISKAEVLPQNVANQVHVQIERASADIQAVAEATIAGQKKAFDQMAAGLISDVSEAKTEVVSLLEADVEPEFMTPSLTTNEIPELQPFPHSTAAPLDATVVPILTADSIRERATYCIDRFRLKNGASGWSFSKIFVKDHISGATEAWLVDPYLAAPHQRRNLVEFILAVGAKLKTINIVTGLENEATAAHDARYFEQLDQGTYDQTGTRICLFRDPEVHDRFAIFDNGIVFKLGRGLDIYKPATGIASGNPELRRVRECEIDIFGIPPEQP